MRYVSQTKNKEIDNFVLRLRQQTEEFYVVFAKFFTKVFSYLVSLFYFKRKRKFSAKNEIKTDFKKFLASGGEDSLIETISNFKIFNGF